MTTEFIQTIDNIETKKKTSIYELLGLIKDGKAPKKVRRYRLGFFKDYKLNSHTATIHRTYESEDGTFLMDLVKIDDEVEILDEEDEFIDIEELDVEYDDDGRIDGVYMARPEVEERKIINDLIKNQQKIINKLKEEGK